MRGAAAAAAAGAAADAVAAALAAAAGTAASNIAAATPAKSSHIFPAIHASASGFATVDTDANDGPHSSAVTSAVAMDASCPNIAKAAAAMKRNLSLAKRDRDTSARSATVKLSVRCLTRTGTSLEWGADWKEEVYLNRGRLMGGNGWSWGLGGGYDRRYHARLYWYLTLHLNINFGYKRWVGYVHGLNHPHRRKREEQDLPMIKKRTKTH
jgi:hypothetical protein